MQEAQSRDNYSVIISSIRTEADDIKVIMIKHGECSRICVQAASQLPQ